MHVYVGQTMQFAVLALALGTVLGWWLHSKTHR